MRTGIVIAVETVEEDGAKLTIIHADTGGGDATRALLNRDPGDDSRPLPGDSVALVGAPGKGAEQVVGIADTANDAVAGAGEKRIYSRSGGGDVEAEIWLKADGSIVVTNKSGGSIRLEPSGSVDINGAVIDASGNISTPGDVTAKDATVPISVSTHLHGGVTVGAGVTTGPQGPP